MKRRVTNQFGMTIIEILVAVVIFMAGFSMLIALMNGSLVKFSAKELLVADNLAHEIMTVATSTQDTTTIDSVIVRSGIHYRVTKALELDGRLAEVRVVVSRAKQERQLAELYCAFVLPRQ